MQDEIDFFYSFFERKIKRPSKTFALIRSFRLSPAQALSTCPTISKHLLCIGHSLYQPGNESPATVAITGSSTSFPLRGNLIISQLVSCSPLRSCIHKIGNRKRTYGLRSCSHIISTSADLLRKFTPQHLRTTFSPFNLTFIFLVLLKYKL